MTNTDGLARERASREKVAQRRREAQLERDRDNRHAFLRGYFAAMCRRNAWTYNERTGEDVRQAVALRRVSRRALVEMARTAESFRRAQYSHLDAAAWERAERTGWSEREAWDALGAAFGTSRDLQTPAFLRLSLGAAGDTLQGAAYAYGRAGLYAVAREPVVELDSHYQDENGDPKA